MLIKKKKTGFSFRLLAVWESCASSLKGKPVFHFLINREIGHSTLQKTHSHFLEKNRKIGHKFILGQALKDWVS